MILAVDALAGSERMRSFVILNGVNGTDSSEVATQWIETRGATRVIFKLSTAHTAPGSCDADSAFTDSITAWRLVLSDSSIGRNSLGFQVGADSVQRADVGVDSTKLVQVFLPKITNVPLRGAGTGHGRNIIVFALPEAVVGGGQTTGVIAVDYMRLRLTPFTRMKCSSSTVNGDAPVSARTTGLRGLKVVAFVYYPNLP
jgi:hypothetical protein